MLLALARVPAAAAETSGAQRASQFEVPEKLRPRVNFWKDIFAKYGKSQFVIHHRKFPQIVFMAVDLSKEAAQMPPAAFSKLKSAAEKKYVQEVRQALEYLARDEQPETYLQKFISSKMQMLGPGTAKYKEVLKDDLIRTQTGIKEKFEASIKRSGRYLPLIERIFVEDFSLPIELTRMPFIESSFDYTAYSSVGAAGIWQFMPRTAKLYMTVNRYIDERRDPLEASRGAARYLRDAYSRLGSWPLAITSYNHGVAGVAKKVAKMGTSDIVRLIENQQEQVFGFASNNFYPEFLAALEVYDNYHHYFPNLHIDPPIHAKEVEIKRAVSARAMSQQVGVPIEDLKAVNYAVSKAVWDGRYNLPSGYRLKVPDKDTALHLAYMRTDSPKPLIEPAGASSIYGGTQYKVRKGDTLLAIAKKFGTSVATLRSLNSITGSNIRIGQTLRVTPRQGASKAAPVRSAPVRSTATKTYRVRKGDSLWSISIKFGVKIDELRSANKANLIGDNLTVGKTIVIPK
ncbi:MAG: LysM peptidoglycan-binding domain-containing protein [Deltaproteobacteria bacterium]|nr:LysM peptidoglycan-binding domain-containing protein [Deltaproteobacteria bacterium]